MSDMMKKALGVVMAVVGVIIGLNVITGQIGTLATNVNDSKATITSYDSGAGSLLSVSFLLLALLPLLAIIGGVVLIAKSSGASKSM